jgi:hypothetical protein
MRRLLDRLATWWLATGRELGAYAVIRNTQGKRDREGKVTPYIEALDVEGNALPIRIRRDSRIFERMAGFGTPAPVPPNLETVDFPVWRPS